jgi:hypothetical protein
VRVNVFYSNFIKLSQIFNSLNVNKNYSNEELDKIIFIIKRQLKHLESYTNHGFSPFEEGLKNDVIDLLNNYNDRFKNIEKAEDLKNESQELKKYLTLFRSKETIRSLSHRSTLK